MFRLNILKTGEVIYIVLSIEQIECVWFRIRHARDEEIKERAKESPQIPLPNLPSLQITLEDESFDSSDNDADGSDDDIEW